HNGNSHSLNLPQKRDTRNLKKGTPNFLDAGRGHSTFPTLSGGLGQPEIAIRQIVECPPLVLGKKIWMSPFISGNIGMISCEYQNDFMVFLGFVQKGQDDEKYADC
ncbi:MAG TPA: hypothetical protein PKD54_16220, partial [Pirellulaceae bacterium]|nr:hypothetical protein [Pirellulaceae bacterium]